MRSATIPATTVALRDTQEISVLSTDPTRHSATTREVNRSGASRATCSPIPKQGGVDRHARLIGRGKLWHSWLKDSMKYLGIGMSVGLGFGAALGAAVQSVAVGVALGLSFGVAFGMMFSGSGASSPRKKLASDKPSPYPLGL
jgi:hypothetical protein